MSEKSDDIKQLFSHLGLNPSDYQEIRSAPSAGATMTEAPRRWSLLQAINTQTPAARVPPTLTAAVPLPAAVPTPPTPSQWAEILPARSVPGSEAVTIAAPSPSALLAPVSVSAPAAASAPPTRTSTAAIDGLSSLFQSVRATPMPAAASTASTTEPALTGEQAADRLYRELRGSAQTLASRPPPPPVTPPWAGYDPEQETRHAPMPAAPVRVLAPPAPPAHSALPASVPLPPRPLLTPAPADTAPAAVARPLTPPPAASAAPRTPAAPRLTPADKTRASGGLQEAFRRLTEPEPPRAAASGRLRLNYRLPQPIAGSGNKDEHIGDVLKRISGHNGGSR